MRIETIEKLCCPFDQADLKLTVITKDIRENILEGTLICKECRRVYPIVSGIPIMSPDEYREFQLEQPLLQQWINDKVSDNFRLVEK
ncbi:MAG: Trm112 family protein [Ginsengibacter sp.]